MRFFLTLVTTLVTTYALAQEATVKIVPNSPVEYNLQLDFYITQKTPSGTNKGTVTANIIADTEVLSKNDQEPLWIVAPADLKFKVVFGGLNLSYDSAQGGTQERSPIESEFLGTVLRQSLSIPLDPNSDRDIMIGTKPLRDPRLDNSLRRMATHIRKLMINGMTFRVGETFNLNFDDDRNMQGRHVITVKTIEDQEVVLDFTGDHKHIVKDDQRNAVIVSGKSKGQIRIDKTNALLTQITAEGTMRLVEIADNDDKRDPFLKNGDMNINMKFNLSSKPITPASESNMKDTANTRPAARINK